MKNRYPIPRGRIRYAAALLLLCTFALPGPAVRAQQLLVLSRVDDVLQFFDLKSGEEVDRVDIGRFCHEIAIDSARRRIFIPSYRGNTVHEVDLQTHAVRKFVIEGYSGFHGIAASADGETIWITAEDSSVVLELDANNGDIIRAWPTLGDRSHMVLVTANRRKLYVPNINSGSVSIIDRETGTTEVIKTGTGAEGVDFGPDENELWVANRNEGTVSIINTTSDELVSTFGAGGPDPVKLRISPDGSEVWMSHHVKTFLSILDRETHTLIDTVSVGVRPLAITFNDDGSRAYVSRPRANEVLEIDASTREVLRRIPTAANPDGMVWLP